MADLLPWQHEAWQQLTGPGLRAHAWLLHGPAGIGKRALAEQLVAHQLCQQPGSDGPCGRCRTCLLHQAGTHPDFMAIHPEEAGKQVRIDQIRALVDFVACTAQMGGRKLVLIEPLEALNANAANALLKTLEDPSGDTLLLLVSHQPSLLLPTIRSRCLQLACPLPPREQAQAWLASQLGDVPLEAIDELLHLAAGSPLRARSLHAAGVLQRRETVEDEFKQVLREQMLPAVVADRWKDVDMLLLLDWFCSWLLQVQRLQVTGDESLVDDARMARLLVHTARQAAPEQVAALQDWLLQERQKVLGRGNLKREMILEALLLRWARLLSAS